MTNTSNDPQGAGTTLLVLVVDRSGRWRQSARIWKAASSTPRWRDRPACMVTGAQPIAVTRKDAHYEAPAVCRDESHFLVPSPPLEPAGQRRVESLASVRLIGDVPGGILLEGSTTAGSSVTLQLRLIGERETFHCMLRAADEPAENRIVLARDLPPCPVRVDVGVARVLIIGSAQTVRIELEPVRVSIETNGACLEQDRSTEDAGDHLVTLPLGFTRLASGPLAYHESFVAEPDEHFWGLGERFTAFDKRGQLISCWNHDALGAQSAQSYKNVPFMLSSRGYGCFVDTTTNVVFRLLPLEPGVLVGDRPRRGT